MTDSLRAELKRRAEKYNKLQSKFGSLEEIKHSPSSKISEKATELWKTYPNDLEPSMVDECLNLKAFLGQTNSSEKESTDISLIELSKFIRKADIMDLYPNVEKIALRMALNTPDTNCTGERSFSTLRRIKNYVRSTMGAERLSATAIRTIEAEITKKVGFENIIDDFASKKKVEKNNDVGNRHSTVKLP